MIMKFKYYYMFIGVLLMISCNNDMVPNLSAPTFNVTTDTSFNVTTDTSTVKAGQPITFLFTGTAHTISFYSGEALKDYSFKDGRVVDVTGAGATMEFSSSLQTGGTQKNNLSIWASTDFNGDYSSVAKVKAATWTDITSRFSLSTSPTFVLTGAKNISDLIVSGKPIYIAFKYVTNSQAPIPNGNGLARQRYIQTFAIKSKPNSATPIALTLADQVHAGFRIVDNSPTTNPAASSVTTTRVTLWAPEYRVATLTKYDSTLPKWNKLDPMYNRNSPLYNAAAVWTPYVPFDSSAVDNDPVSETWAVSAPISTTSVDRGPDYSTPIKAGPAAPMLLTYDYTYALPGTYTAVFVGFNATMDVQKTVVQKMTIVVVP